jgi:nitrite reductase/ring-hydroxylating ferredoxin subunit
MSDDANSELRHRWFPVCGVDDLPPQHIFETELLGQELAVWRGTGGTLNVWKNRCPHRGMRFTVGANLGTALRCAYHGYRFDNGSGRCTAIPAHPDRTPPHSVCATVYPVLERYGLVWTTLEGGASPPEPLPAARGGAVALYSVAVSAGSLRVGQYLSRYHFRPSGALNNAGSVGGEGCTTRAIDGFTFESVAVEGHMTSTVLLFTQPVDSACTVIHARLMDAVECRLLMPALRHHAEQLSQLRSTIEAGAIAIASASCVARRI